MPATKIEDKVSTVLDLQQPYRLFRPFLASSVTESYLSLIIKLWQGIHRLSSQCRCVILSTLYIIESIIRVHQEQSCGDHTHNREIMSNIKFVVVHFEFWRNPDSQIPRSAVPETSSLGSPKNLLENKQNYSKSHEIQYT